jgi:hypothetical protein
MFAYPNMITTFKVNAGPNFITHARGFFPVRERLLLENIAID